MKSLQLLHQLMKRLKYIENMFPKNPHSMSFICVSTQGHNFDRKYNNK